MDTSANVLLPSFVWQVGAVARQAGADGQQRGRVSFGNTAGRHADGEREAIRLQAERCGRRRSQETNKQAAKSEALWIIFPDCFFCKFVHFLALSLTFDTGQFLLPLVRRLVGSSASSQCLRDKFIQKRQRGVHLEKQPGKHRCEANKSFVVNLETVFSSNSGRLWFSLSTSCSSSWLSELFFVCFFFPFVPSRYSDKLKCVWTSWWWLI